MRTSIHLKFASLCAVIGFSYLAHRYIYNSNMPSPRTFKLDPRLFNPQLYDSVLKLWFEGLPEGATAPTQDLAMRWYGLGASESAKARFDQECRAGFVKALDSIGPTKFPLPTPTGTGNDLRFSEIAEPFLGEFGENNTTNPDAALGLILLLDQLPRNSFRADQAVIYGHYDPIARAVFDAIHQRKVDEHEKYLLSPVHRSWFYMPLMHSENAADHDLFTEKMADLKARLEEKGDQRAVECAETSLTFEKKHADIIRKFGRYPHRNRWLGRKTTEAERKWSEAGGDSFAT
jgi:uncharacterized protein (DUF924 family)